MEERHRIKLRHVADVNGACAEVGVWLGNVSGVGSAGARLSFCVRSSAGPVIDRSGQLRLSRAGMFVQN